MASPPKALIGRMDLAHIYRGCQAKDDGADGGGSAVDDLFFVEAVNDILAVEFGIDLPAQHTAEILQLVRVGEERGRRGDFATLPRLFRPG
jgi:hypothetical protein